MASESDAWNAASRIVSPKVHAKRGYTDRVFAVYRSPHAEQTPRTSTTFRSAMNRSFLPVFVLLFAALTIADVSAQTGVDEVITWRSYSAERSAHVRVLASGDRDRPFTVVIDESNDGAAGPVTDEARFVAETIGRTFGFDPVEAFFVFRFQVGSSTGASSSNKVLLLRATFRRGASGDLGAPSWRVISRESLTEITDRAL